MSTPNEILEKFYITAQTTQGELNAEQLAWVETIITYAENQKAVLTVLITSLTKKIETPEQDIRQHKVELPNGYSGRSYDTQHITPFMRRKFPRLSMSESGWLTRSLEQVHAFDFNFPGKISNKSVKQAFLSILHNVEEQPNNATEYLLAIFHRLSQQYQQIPPILQKLENTITIQQILDLLSEHFFTSYQVAGGARLPVLAIYAIYTLMITSNRRYEGKQLAPLKSHTTADTKSHGIADIEVIYSDGTFFEAIEVKHEKPVTISMIEYVVEKIRYQQIERYYILTTADPNIAPNQEIAPILRHTLQNQGCEIIVNGVLPTIKYYLRLLDNPMIFLNTYTNILSTDTAIKAVHISKWQTLLQSINKP